MIRSFKHKGLKLFYEKGDRSKLPPALMGRIEEILTVLNAAQSLDDIALPYLRLHPLTGERKGEWAVTVRANWRIVFRFDHGEPEQVDFTDYH